MAVKTMWPITYACGHSQDRDLSTLSADQRAGHARWLSCTDCTDCWRSKQGDADERQAREDWLARQRDHQQAEIQEWDQHTGMGRLTGPANAADWGRRCRRDLLADAHQVLVAGGRMAEDQFADSIQAPARRIDLASWWIDNRDSDPADLAELLQAAQPTEANPAATAARR